MADSLEIVPRESIKNERWDDFVDACSEAWFWHRSDIQDAFSTWPGKSDHSFAVVDRASSGEIIAVVPVHKIKQRIIRVFPWNILDSLGGPACRNDLEKKHKKRTLQFIHSSLIQLAQKHNAKEIRIALPSMAPSYRGENCPRVNPLLSMKFSNALTQTWIIDLKPGKDIIWKNMEGRARTEVRKAEKERVEVRLADRKDDLSMYYRLHSENYKRTGAKPFPRKYFEKIWDNFFTKGLSCIFFALYKNEVVAAENFAVYKNASIYWTGAADNTGLAVGANSLLQWTAIQWMIEKKLEWYETGEAFPGLAKGKLKGLSDFKKSFGGELYPFYKGRISTAGKAGKILMLLKQARQSL